MKGPKNAGKYDGWMVGVGSMSEDQNAANPLTPYESKSIIIWTLKEKASPFHPSPVSLTTRAGWHDKIFILHFFLFKAYRFQIIFFMKVFSKKKKKIL